MRIIQCLEELIEEEIRDVKKYAKLAAELKSEYPALSQTLYTISTQEDSHHAAIHGEVVKIIEQHRKAHGDPPANMQSVYEYLHKKNIDKLADARRYQEIYRSM